MKILAIETSCDETAAAVVENGVTVLGSAVASSSAMHEKYGGIVPEVAAREQLKCVIPTIEEALKQANMSLCKIDSLAITIGPGLIGSLLIGVETAKTIAMTTGKPIIPVNHVLAHMYANFVHSDGQNSSRGSARDNIKYIQFPAISMVVSGGHTELFLMESEKKLTWLGGTLDDAAGEAFDKTARLLGFGNGGGVSIQNAASHCHPGLDPGSKQKMDSGSEAGMTNNTIHLPRPLLHDDTLNFSFSGLKTAILREVNKLKTNNQLNERVINQLAFETQESITDVLVKKTLRAANQYSTKSILLSGGVAANLRLREKMQTTMNDERLTMNFFVPPVSLCTDNAVYIASYAFFRGKPVDWHEITAVPDLSVEDV